MEQERIIKQTFFVAYIAIGAIGAIGQAMFLQNLLVHSYPFKMMDMESYRIYSLSGQIGVIIAPAMAFVGSLFFHRDERYWLPVIAVTLCPILYLMVFACFWSFLPHESIALHEPQFDGDSKFTVNLYLVKNVLALSGLGALIGFVCGVVVSLFEDGVSALTRRLP
jgi:hypothetical protein